MRSLIVCVSVSHGNTRKIADAMADELQARVIDPDHSFDLAELAGCDLVGFGSGIFRMAFHPRLREFVHALPPCEGTKAFVFSTRGGPKFTSWPYMSRMVQLLQSKGYDVVGTFSCRGFDTWRPLQLVGGLNKGHPDTHDIAEARAFARRLVQADRTETPRAA